MGKRKKMFEVEIKSQAILREGKKSLITFFEGYEDEKDVIPSHVMKLYPQYADPDDKPVVNVTPITRKEFANRQKGIFRKNMVLVDAKGEW